MDIFPYFATTADGARALYTSFEKRLLVRVFRSSKLHGTSPYAPPKLQIPASKGKSSGAVKKTSYRYDGLYVVQQVVDESDQTILFHRNVLQTMVGYRFVLQRIRSKKDGNRLSFKNLIRKIRGLESLM